MTEQFASTPSSIASPAGTYAVWADRAIAAVLDLLIALAALVVINVLFAGVFTGIGGLMSLAGNTGSMSGVDAAGSLGCLTCVAWLFLPAVVYFGVGLYNKVALVARRGYSIGQGVVKLRVVTADGGNVPLGTLIIRLLVVVVFLFIPFLPLLDLLWPLWDDKRQTLHDKAVGTFVLKSASAIQLQ